MIQQNSNCCPYHHACNAWRLSLSKDHLQCHVFQCTSRVSFNCQWLYSIFITANIFCLRMSDTCFLWTMFSFVLEVRQSLHGYRATMPGDSWWAHQPSKRRVGVVWRMMNRQVGSSVNPVEVKFGIFNFFWKVKVSKLSSVGLKTPR